MPEPQMVINVYGRLVQDVFSTIPNLRVTVVDWDSADRSVGEPGVVCVTCEGREYLACVSDMATRPTESLPGSDVARALQAAGLWPLSANAAGQPQSASVRSAVASSPLKRPVALSVEQLTTIVQRLQEVLYLDHREGVAVWNLDKEWSTVDMLVELASVMEQYDLIPGAASSQA